MRSIKDRNNAEEKMSWDIYLLMHLDALHEVLRVIVILSGCAMNLGIGLGYIFDRDPILDLSPKTVRRFRRMILPSAIVLVISFTGNLLLPTQLEQAIYMLHQKGE